MNCGLFTLCLSLHCITVSVAFVESLKCPALSSHVFTLTLVTEILLVFNDCPSGGRYGGSLCNIISVCKNRATTEASLVDKVFTILEHKYYIFGWQDSSVVESRPRTRKSAV